MCPSLDWNFFCLCVSRQRGIWKQYTKEANTVGTIETFVISFYILNFNSIYLYICIFCICFLFYLGLRAHPRQGKYRIQLGGIFVLCCVAFRSVMFRYVALHCVTLHCIILHHVNSSLIFQLQCGRSVFLWRRILSCTRDQSDNRTYSRRRYHGNRSWFSCGRKLGKWPGVR